MKIIKLNNYYKGKSADKFKGKAIRLGQKAVVGAVDKKLGKKFARGLDAGINAYRGEPTAGIPSWVPKGPQYTNVGKMQAFYRQRAPVEAPRAPTMMVNRYVTQNTYLGRQLKM